MSLLTKTHVLETALDIAYLAGAKRYHSGDSRADIDTFIAWANEFETHLCVDADGNETYFGEDYLTAIEEFTNERLVGEHTDLSDEEWIVRDK